jgi:hypothetical protein
MTVRIKTGRELMDPRRGRGGVVTLLGLAALTAMGLTFATVALNRADDSRRLAALAVRAAQALAAAEGAAAAQASGEWSMQSGSPLVVGNCVVTGGQSGMDPVLRVTVHGIPGAGQSVAEGPVGLQRLWKLVRTESGQVSLVRDRSKP